MVLKKKLILMALAPPVDAQGKINNPALSDKIRNMPGPEFIGKLISAFVSIFLIAGAIVFFFLLILGGIQWMMAGGDKAAIEQARGRITSAAIGLVVLFAAWALILVLETFLGITILSGPIKLPTLGK